MSRKSDRLYKIKSITVSEAKLSEGNWVALHLQTTTKHGDETEFEVLLTPDLAVRHGKALFDLGTALQGQDGK